MTRRSSDADPPPRPSADALVSQVLGGDTQAYAELIRMYERDIWMIAATLIRDWGATESLVQQVFMDAYANLHRYERGTDFGAWVRTVARNRLRKELRSAAREDRRLAVYRERLAERLKSEERAHDDSEEYLAALRNCRAQLPEEDAALIRMRYERGMSFETIAARRSQTPAAVQRAISRIRCRLRACVEGQVNPK